MTTAKNPALAGKIPVSVITGFLGAGKTTLVRHVLGHAKGKRLALIINEFGDIGVDKSVLAACGEETCREEDMIELANGCICCTVAEDFIPTMAALLARPDRPDHIIIETSGLALPQPLIRAFNWPEIKSGVTIDGVVTVVDAAALSEGRFAADEAAVDVQRKSDQMLDHLTPLGELFADQLIAADLIIVNKTDLLDEAAIAGVEAELKRQMRPGTGMLRASNGHVDVAALLGLGLATEDNLGGRDSAHELEHGGAGHEHDDFDSFSLRLPEVSKERLLSTITATIEAQAVGPRLNAYFDRPWADGEKRETALVVIGESPLDRAAITTSLLLAG
jgi:cobalamin biosynthesis protein CobW